MDDFLVWFFSLKMDAIIGPWLKDNAVTIGFMIWLPYYIFKWIHGNIKKIKALKNEREE